MKTPQEIFDTVVNHLRKQNSQSVAYNPDGTMQLVHGDHGGPVCLYRSEDGKRCAAGALISDEQYTPAMEGKNISAVISEFHLEDLEPHRRLVSELQTIHDFHQVQTWEREFEYLAKTFSLTYTPPEK